MLMPSIGRHRVSDTYKPQRMQARVTSVEKYAGYDRWGQCTADIDWLLQVGQRWCEKAMTYNHWVMWTGQGRFSRSTLYIGWTMCTGLNHCGSPWPMSIGEWHLSLANEAFLKIDAFANGIFNLPTLMSPCWCAQPQLLYQGLCLRVVCQCHLPEPQGLSLMLLDVCQCKYHLVFADPPRSIIVGLWWCFIHWQYRFTDAHMSCKMSACLGWCFLPLADTVYL